MGLFGWDIQSFFVTLIVLFTSMPVHEYAHGWVAYKLGDSTAYYQGRLNLNPLRHLDPIGSLMLIVTQRFGWAKPVPVNPRNFNRTVTMRGGMALTSLAGPAANILLAAILMTVQKVLTVMFFAGGFMANNAVVALVQILSIMVSINISLAVFNLLPIPPLDGFNIFSYFIPAKIEYKIAQYSRQIYLILLGVMLFTPLLSYPLHFLSNLVYRLLNFLTSFVDLIGRMLI